MEAVAAAVAQVAREQFGSAETAFMWMMEVLPKELNAPDPDDILVASDGEEDEDEEEEGWGIFASGAAEERREREASRQERRELLPS